MQEIELFNKWIKNATSDPDLVAELNEIKDNQAEIYDRFYKELEFGTAGLRGVIGAGTNRINIYTVRKVSQGLSDYLNSKYNNSSICISFDSRIKSNVFAKEAACVFAANNIKVFIAKELNPVPFLSFSVRYLKCNAGVMITASHNPAKYNGYKCYGSDGCQMTDKFSSEAYSYINSVDAFCGIKTMDFSDGLDSGKIEYINEHVTAEYLKAVEDERINTQACLDTNLKVVYTPLNGAGNKLVRKVFEDIGVRDVFVVKEQEFPDGNFPTCRYPNPEDPEALTLAIDLAKKEKADIVIATDPDSDRIGIAVFDGDEYKLVTGNEVGVMLLEYILSCKKNNGTLPKKPVTIKTIVSTDLADKIAIRYGCEMKSVLTGFKYIGEQILLLEQKGQEDRFLFGFEESYGYMVGNYVRDKDGVVAAMLICEMAAFYKKQGKTLIDVINKIYSNYGYYKSITLSYAFEGTCGMDKMKQIMETLRFCPPKRFADLALERVCDYFVSEDVDIETGTKRRIDLPRSNVISYYLTGKNKVIVRPSGTEPKIKVYITAVAENCEDCNLITEKIKSFVERTLGL